MRSCHYGDAILAPVVDTEEPGYCGTFFCGPNQCIRSMLLWRLRGGLVPELDFKLLSSAPRYGFVGTPCGM